MDPLIDVIDESAGVDARWFVAVTWFDAPPAVVLDEAGAVPGLSLVATADESPCDCPLEPGAVKPGDAEHEDEPVASPAAADLPSPVPEDAALG